MQFTRVEDDWYDKRCDLSVGQVFETVYGSIVRLDRRVPGDGTQWYADVWYKGYKDRWYWSCEDTTVEPGDLIALLPNFETESKDVQ